MQLTIIAYLLPHCLLVDEQSKCKQSVFRSFFEKEKLSGPNFIYWYRNMMIVLTVEDKLNFLEQPIPATHVPAKEQEYDGFVPNYNMHGIGKTVNELRAMLKLDEEILPKKEAAPALHNQGKRTTKLAYAPNPKIHPPHKKNNPAKDAICHECNEIGHQRKNCPKYLAELMKKMKLSQGVSTSGIFTIELYSFLNKSYVYDTGYGTHICNTTRGLRRSKKLKPRALNLYVDNGHREAIKAIRTFHLRLPMD
ncbi:zinc finger, CCHC-type containing protein [Tanacetum coccineum]